MGIGEVGIEKGDNNEGVSRNIIEGEINDDVEVGIRAETKENEYHYVTVVNRLDNKEKNNQKFVENSKMKDDFQGLELGRQNHRNFERNYHSIIGRINNSSRDSGEYDISVGRSDDGKVDLIDSRKVNLDKTDVKIESKSNYLEMLIRRSVKCADNQDSTGVINQKSTDNNDRDVKGSVEFDHINVKSNSNNAINSNVDQNKADTKNATNNDKSKESLTGNKVNKNIHRRLDKNMENLQYNYYQEAEKFWNTNYSKYLNDVQRDSNASNDSIVDQTDIKNIKSNYIKTGSEHIDSQTTINDLVKSLNDLNVENERKINETMYYTHQNSNVDLKPEVDSNRTDTTKSATTNFKENDTHKSNSSLLNKLKMIKSNKLMTEETTASSIRDDNANVYHRRPRNDYQSNQSKTFETQEQKRFDMNRPHSSKSYNDEYDSNPSNFDAHETVNFKDIDIKRPYSSRNNDIRRVNKKSDTYHSKEVNYMEPNRPQLDKNLQTHLKNNRLETQEVVSNRPLNLTNINNEKLRTNIDVNKENVTTNVINKPDPRQTVNVVKIDDGNRIRSAVLLRKLELYRNT